MIYEIRTYQIGPGNLAEVEKRFGEAYEYRKKYSPLTAFLHTEIGPLNEIIHIWRYSDLAERARVRADAAKDANWPPKIQEFIRKMSSEIVVPFSFQVGAASCAISRLSGGSAMPSPVIGQSASRNVQYISVRLFRNLSCPSRLRAEEAPENTTGSTRPPSASR